MLRRSKRISRPISGGIIEKMTVNGTMRTSDPGESVHDRKGDTAEEQT